MSLDVLKLMIESACASGAVSEEEMEHLREKAREANLKDQDLQFLLKAELEKVRSQAQLSSGFVSDQQPQNKSTKLGSGFVVSESGLKETSFNPSSEFTNVETLETNGAMSIIQRAKYFGKWVIIKRLLPEHRQDAKYKILFFREFENAYHLDHPHVVRFFGKGEDAEGPYYYMEYIDGRPLTKLIAEEKTHDFIVTKRILLQLLDVLAYIHKKQVYHRDLKPDNIMITYKGDNIKLIDFGLAAADSFEDHLLKVGTPKYAAPEQRKAGHLVDQRADIYALGLILLEMLTGTLDFNKINGIGDRNLKVIIHRSVQPKPEDRFASCEDISDLLAQEQKRIMPDWLIRKLKHYTEDGIVSDNEWRVLKMDARNCDIAPDYLQAMVDLELEKAKERIRIEREKEQLEYERKRKTDIEHEQLEAEKRKREKELQAQLRAKDIELKKARRSSKRRSPARRVLRFLLIFILLAGMVLIVYNWLYLKYYYYRYLSAEEEDTQVEILYVNTNHECLNLRTQPEINDTNIVICVPRGEEVLVYEVVDSLWVRVDFDGDEGYMFSEYLSAEQPE